VLLAVIAAERGGFWKQEFRLQCGRIILTGNTREIAGGRMARITFAGAVEIGFAGFGVTGQNIENLRIRPAAERVVHTLMEIVRKVGNLRPGQTGRSGATLHGMPFLQKWPETASVAVMQYDRGTYQIGALLIFRQGAARSPRERTMTGDAFGNIDGLAAISRGGTTEGGGTVAVRFPLSVVV